MTAAGLYDDTVANLVRESLPHVWTVQFRDKAGAVIPVDAKTCEVTFDRDWWPYVQGTIVAVVPDQATLDRLDPRRIVSVTVEAGYVLPDGTRDVHPLAVLYLSGRSVTRPGDELVLSVQGQEYVLGRAVNTYMPYAADPSWTVADVLDSSSEREVRYCVGRALSAAGYVPFNIGNDTGWDYENASAQTGWSGGTLGVPATWPERYGADTPNPGVVWVDVARDIAELTGCWLRCDETGLWKCTGPGGPTGMHPMQARTVLSVGANGTVIESDTRFERDTEWANMVVIHYSWEADTGGLGRYGVARVTSGPFSVDTVGCVARTFDESRPYFVSQSTANSFAGQLLSRLLNRGRQIRLGAVAAYWLRPTDAVTVQLPLGPQERHTVGAVTYVLHEGRMSVTSYLPDTTSQITLGGA